MHCLSFFTVNIERFLINFGMVYNAIAMYQEIRNNVKRRIFVTIGSTSIFWTNDVIYHTIWGHLLPLPYQFSIFEDVGFDSPGKTTAYSCLMTWGLMTITSIGSFSNDDGHSNKNVKTATGLLIKTTSLHVHHTFLYIS